jgi:hypothetical protein
MKLSIFRARQVPAQENDDCLSWIRKLSVAGRTNGAWSDLPLSDSATSTPRHLLANSGHKARSLRPSRTYTSGPYRKTNTWSPRVSTYCYLNCGFHLDSLARRFQHLPAIWRAPRFAMFRLMRPSRTILSFSRLPLQVESRVARGEVRNVQNVRFQKRRLRAR